MLSFAAPLSKARSKVGTGMAHQMVNMLIDLIGISFASFPKFQDRASQVSWPLLKSGHMIQMHSSREIGSRQPILDVVLMPSLLM